MEIKHCIALEVKKDNDTFVFYIPKDTTWGKSLDAAWEILQKVNELSQISLQQAKPQQTEE